MLFTAKSNIPLQAVIAGQTISLELPKVIAETVTTPPDIPFWIHIKNRPTDLQVTGGIGIHAGSNTLFDRAFATRAESMSNITIKSVSPEPNDFVNIHSIFVLRPEDLAQHKTDLSDALTFNNMLAFPEFARGAFHWSDIWKLTKPGTGDISWRMVNGGSTLSPMSGIMADGFALMLHTPTANNFSRTPQEVLEQGASRHNSAGTRPTTDGQMANWSLFVKVDKTMAMLCKRTGTQDTLFSRGSYQELARMNMESGTQVNPPKSEQDAQFWASLQDGKIIIGQGPQPEQSDINKRFAFSSGEKLAGELCFFCPC